jgi:hypothetical protein
MQPVAADVRSVVIPDTGHFIAEESPDELLAELTPFLSPYRDGSADRDGLLREITERLPGRV